MKYELGSRYSSKCLPCENEKPTLATQNPCENPGVMSPACNPSAEEMETEGWMPGAFWPADLAYSLNSRPMRYPDSKIKRNVPEDQHLHIHVTHTHTHSMIKADGKVTS